MSPRRPDQSDTRGEQAAEARSSAAEKMEKAEAEKGLDPSTATGQRLHEAYRENA